MKKLSIKDIAKDLGISEASLRVYLNDSKYHSLREFKKKEGYFVYFLEGDYLEWKKNNFKGSNKTLQQKMEE